MTDESQQDRCAASRRCVLLGAGVLGMAGVLTACSTAAVPYDAGDGGQVEDPPPSVGPNGQAELPAGSPTTPVLLAAVSTIPVGGGVAFDNVKVVVTQPTKGQIKAFSAVCTHVGCLCNTVSDGTINCPCHGSKFKITDGSVVAGPAPSPLPAAPITVTNGQVYLA